MVYGLHVAGHHARPRCRAAHVQHVFLVHDDASAARHRGAAAVEHRDLGTEALELARINKKTFNRYYETLEDLLAEVMATHAASWRKRASNLHLPDGFAEVTREFFLFGAEQDALYDAITCDPAWDAIQRSLQDDASGEHVENVPEGYTPERWHLVYAWQSGAVLNMYRAWVTDGKTIPVEKLAELAVSLVCRGIDAIEA